MVNVPIGSLQSSQETAVDGLAAEPDPAAAGGPAIGALCGGCAAAAGAAGGAETPVDAAVDDAAEIDWTCLDA